MLKHFTEKKLRRQANSAKDLDVLTSLPHGSNTGCIGIEIKLPSAGDAAPIKVARVWPGSLAEVAGIKPNWFILSVDGLDAVGMSAEQFFSSAFGTVGTFVTLELADPTMSQTTRITIKRELVKFPAFLVQPSIYEKPAIFDTPPNYSPEQRTAVVFASASVI